MYVLVTSPVAGCSTAGTQRHMLAYSAELHKVTRLCCTLRNINSVTIMEKLRSSSSIHIMITISSLRASEKKIQAPQANSTNKACRCHDGVPHVLFVGLLNLGWSKAYLEVHET